MKIIVGLGNPGKEYEKTRHNVGFLTLDKLAKKINMDFDKNKCKANYGIYKHNDEKKQEKISVTITHNIIISSTVKSEIPLSFLKGFPEI